MLATLNKLDIAKFITNQDLLYLLIYIQAPTSASENWCWLSHLTEL